MDFRKLIASIVILTGGFGHGSAGANLMVKAFNVGRSLAVSMEIQLMAELILLDSITEDDPRTQSQFVSYIRGNMLNRVGQRRDTSLDFWGRAYRYDRNRFGFRITSAGPDGKFGTKDDITIAYSRNVLYAGR